MLITVLKNYGISRTGCQEKVLDLKLDTPGLVDVFVNSGVSLYSTKKCLCLSYFNVNKEFSDMFALVLQRSSTTIYVYTDQASQRPYRTAEKHGTIFFPQR